MSTKEKKDQKGGLWPCRDISSFKSRPPVIEVESMEIEDGENTSGFSDSRLPLDPWISIAFDFWGGWKVDKTEEE